MSYLNTESEQFQETLERKQRRENDVDIVHHVVKSFVFFTVLSTRVNKTAK